MDFYDNIDEIEAYRNADGTFNVTVTANGTNSNGTPARATFIIAKATLELSVTNNCYANDTMEIILRG